MSFEPSLLVDKLAKLNESADSIHTLSKWIQHHHRFAREIAALWASYTANQAPIDQYLALVYVANDVMQRTRKKSDLFSIEFAKHLPTIVPPIYAKLNSDLRAKLVRVVNILKERNCLPEKPYLQLRKSLEALAPAPTASASTSTSKPTPTTATSSATPTPSNNASFRAPTHPASTLRPLSTSTIGSPSHPPPLASPTLDPIHNIARDIVACKDLVSPLLDAKTRAAMSPAAIRALITPEFLKKYKHAVSALEFVHQQQTVTVKFVEQVLADLDRPSYSTPVSATQSPAILKHARSDSEPSNGTHSNDTIQDPRQFKRPRASPPVAPAPPVLAATAAMPSMDHFAFMTSMTPSPNGPSSGTAAAAGSPVPDPMELLKKLTSGPSGTPFSILGSAASPSVPAPAPLAPTTAPTATIPDNANSKAYSPTSSAASASTSPSTFDPMHFLSMSPPPPSSQPSFPTGLTGLSEFGAAPLPPGLVPPPMPHLWPADGQGMGMVPGLGAPAGGFVAVPTILASSARPVSKDEEHRSK
ncbi:hypothetical protein BCR44DRAFT_25186 [Catenaria anguillulae PL171]|uniref:CID domain-containing protein n=1 Tax=Catenaria anguillulae PL171 TaxID=765915 RepID=A0A1Y2HEZ7_9FUNG|nr:hypothetical protein BCR44DRAFT_25186 [Catenaria anguillulae PL171]